MKTFHIAMAEQELQALTGLLDAGIKATGLAGVKAGAVLLEKLEQAVVAANAPPKKEDDGGAPSATEGAPAA